VLIQDRPFQETDDVYEEWLLTYHKSSRSVNRSRGFLGLRFKSYYEDPGYWLTNPELKTQGEMKEQHLFAIGGISAERHKGAMQKAIQRIPKAGGRQIDQLIQDRTYSCSDETVKREWTVVAVRPQQKYPYSSAKKWGNDESTTNWLVTVSPVLSLASRLYTSRLRVGRSKHVSGAQQLPGS
jgi:hypothetical protein